jgi:hypothetical protein
MPNDLNPPNLFNPMMLWTDLGMRALEMTVSSSQNISEGLDRLTRATATPEDSPVSAEASSARTDRRQPVTASSGLAFSAEMQRATFDLMTQAWQQWMKTVGMLVSMGAGHGFGEAVARQVPLLKTMQEGLEAAANAGRRTITQSSPARSERQQSGRQRERGVHDMEHAFGAAETKRRSRGGRAKPKTRSRSS